MQPTKALTWPARIGYLIFLWAVLALLTAVTVGKVLPHLVEIPVVGWPIGLFMATVFLSLYLGAIQMTGRILTGGYAGPT